MLFFFIIVLIFTNCKISQPDYPTQITYLVEGTAEKVSIYYEPLEDGGYEKYVLFYGEYIHSKDGPIRERLPYKDTIYKKEIAALELTVYNCDLPSKQTSITISILIDGDTVASATGYGNDGISVFYP